MQPANFYKPFSWLMLVIVLLLSGMVFYIIAKKDDSKFSFTAKQLAEIPVFAPPPGGGKVDPALAHEMIRQYHLKGRSILVLTPKKLGLWHDDASLRNYVDTIFPKYCKDHDVANTVYKDYKWKIGFYYSLSRKTPASDYMLNVCLIPTLVNDAGDVIDFYLAWNNPLYKNIYPPKRIAGEAITQSADNYVYDTGEIWP